MEKHEMDGKTKEKGEKNVSRLFLMLVKHAKLDILIFLTAHLR